MHVQTRSQKCQKRNIKAVKASGGDNRVHGVIIIAQRSVNEPMFVCLIQS